MEYLGHQLGFILRLRLKAKVKVIKKEKRRIMVT